MNDSSTRKIYTSSYSMPYDTQSTNLLLKQLQISIKDVESIIKKSKQTLGMTPNALQVKSPTMTNQASQLNLNVSISIVEYSPRDQLNYSISPKTDSRVKNIQTFKLENIRSLSNNQQKDPVRRLKFEQSEQNLLAQSYSSKDETLNTVEQTKAYARESWGIKQQQIPQQHESYQTDIKIQHQKIEKQLLDEEEQKYNERKNLLMQKTNNLTPQQKMSSNNENETTKRRTNYFIKFNSFEQITKRCDFEQEYKVEKWEKKSPKRKQQKQKQITKQEPLIEDGLSNPEKERKIQYFNKNPYKSQLKAQVYNFSQLKKQNSNKPKAESFYINKKQLGNTCSKNQLQNILFSQSQSKKKKDESPLKSIPYRSEKSISMNKSASKSSSKAETSNKLASQSASKLASKRENIKNKEDSPVIKSAKKYIEYFHKAKKYKSIPDQKQKSKVNKIPISEPKNINKQCINCIDSPTKSKYEYENRETFLKQMQDQCYVRRFLNQTQLNQIYNEFMRKKVAKSKWGEKIIEKIFRKIHQTQHII